MERRPPIPPDVQYKQQFSKLRRQVGALERQGAPIPEDKVMRMQEIDFWLTQNTSYWRSHFGFLKEGEREL